MTNQPLLVLHGGPGLSDYMDSAADEMTGWRTLRYTQRGVPPAPVDGPFTVDQHVADALEQLDRADVASAAVLGHSWGGFLAVALAAAAPDRVRGLLLVDPLGIVDDGGFAGFNEEMLARTPEESRVRLEELDQRAMTGDGTAEEARESLRLSWPAYFAEPGSAPPMPDDIRFSLPCYSQTLESLLSVLTAGTLPEQVATYAGPVELVHGEQSPIPREAMLATADAFPNARTTGVPGAGHFTWLEQPGCVREGLDRLAARL